MALTNYLIVVVVVVVVNATFIYCIYICIFCSEVNFS